MELRSDPARAIAVGQGELRSKRGQPGLARSYQSGDLVQHPPLSTGWSCRRPRPRPMELRTNPARAIAVGQGELRSKRGQPGLARSQSSTTRSAPAFSIKYDQYEPS